MTYRMSSYVMLRRMWQHCFYLSVQYFNFFR